MSNNWTGLNTFLKQQYVQIRILCDLVLPIVSESNTTVLNTNGKFLLQFVRCNETLLQTKLGTI